MGISFISVVLSLFLSGGEVGHPVKDTLLAIDSTMGFVLLPEVTVTPDEEEEEKVSRRASRKKKREAKRISRLEYNVRKAYPYAKAAGAEIDKIERLMLFSESEHERDSIIDEEYRILMEEFKEPLMKLTVTQGRILVRLVCRETCNTAFRHIVNYRGRVTAVFWQTLGLLFGNNLQAEYDPAGEDKEIEQFVIALEEGRLKPIL